MAVAKGTPRYHLPERTLRSSNIWAKIEAASRELYPWVDPETWYPAVPGQAGLGVIQLVTQFGPRMVYQRHFEIRRSPPQEPIG